MKKLFALIFILALLLTLCACGKDELIWEEPAVLVTVPDVAADAVVPDTIVAADAAEVVEASGELLPPDENGMPILPSGDPMMPPPGEAPAEAPAEEPAAEE